MVASAYDRVHWRWLFGCLASVALVALVAAVHPLVLRAAGRLLVASEPVEHVDLAVMTADSGAAGLLELSDLFHDHLAERLALLSPAPMAADRELERRGVHPHDDRRDVLIELGVPGERILSIPAREVGTTGSTAALREWCRTHSVGRLLVVVSATHGRRFRRALRREWDDDASLPLVKAPRFDAFNADRWWRSRSTLREGIVETEKLLLDVVTHPFEFLR